MIKVSEGGIRDWLDFELQFQREQGRERFGTHYISPQDLILREGVEHPLAEYDGDRWGYEGQAKNCFRDAYQLAWLHPDELAYVEGYAQGLLVVPHAWNVEIATGTVVDATYAAAGFSARAYLGIPFTLDFLEEATDASGKYGIIDDWERAWPILWGALDPTIVDQRALAAP